VLALPQSETYKRYRPETTLLYQLVERYYPEVTGNLTEQGDCKQGKFGEKKKTNTNRLYFIVPVRFIV